MVYLVFTKPNVSSSATFHKLKKQQKKKRLGNGFVILQKSETDCNNSVDDMGLVIKTWFMVD